MTQYPTNQPDPSVSVRFRIPASRLEGVRLFFVSARGNGVTRQVHVACVLQGQLHAADFCQAQFPELNVKQNPLLRQDARGWHVATETLTRNVWVNLAFFGDVPLNDYGIDLVTKSVVPIDVSQVTGYAEALQAFGNHPNFRGSRDPPRPLPSVAIPSAPSSPPTSQDDANVSQPALMPQETKEVSHTHSISLDFTHADDPYNRGCSSPPCLSSPSAKRQHIRDERPLSVHSHTKPQADASGSSSPKASLADFASNAADENSH